MKKEELLRRKKEILRENRLTNELYEEEIKKFSQEQLRIMTGIINRIIANKIHCEPIAVLDCTRIYDKNTKKIIDIEKMVELTEEEIERSAAREIYKKTKIREEMDKMFALREHDYKFIKDYVSHFIV